MLEKEVEKSKPGLISRRGMTLGTRADSRNFTSRNGRILTIGKSLVSRVAVPLLRAVGEYCEVSSLADEDPDLY